MSGFHQTRERRKQLRDEEAPRARRDARRVASLLGDLEDSVDHDQKVFRAFAATLPSMQLQPPSSLADWTAFQRHFYLMAMEVKTGVVGCGIPLSHSMSERASRA